MEKRVIAIVEPFDDTYTYYSTTASDNEIREALEYSRAWQEYYQDDEPLSIKQEREYGDDIINSKARCQEEAFEEYMNNYTGGVKKLKISKEFEL